MTLIYTMHDYDYSRIDERVFTHKGCIVDVGCSGWDWSKIFFEKKRVIGVDPFESPVDGVEFFEGVLGAANGTAEVYANSHATTVVESLNHVAEHENTYKFPMLTWKSFCKKFNITSVSALKINIEGGEYALLHSMDADDYKHIDQIVVSFHDFENSKLRNLTESSIEMLKSMGYDAICLNSRFNWYLFTKNTMNTMNTKVTVVTGLWDLGRGGIEGWAKRDFQEYKERFLQMLEADVPMCIWIPHELEEDVWKVRKKHNTKIYYKEVEDFKTWFPFFEQHDAIRTNPDWYNYAGWLKDSPQAALEMYNPMMMTKMFMVNDSALYNPFDSEYFYWIDGGLTHTVSHGYFTSGKIFQNIAEAYHDMIVHLSYPYEPNNEIHGFEKGKFFEYCELPSDTTSILISRGGFWGGPKELIHQYNGIYYNILQNTIHEKYIGADECLFTIAAYQHPEIIERFEIESNGLVWPFFEAMQDIENFTRPERVLKTASTKFDYKTSVYVLGFNSPKQFEMVCESFLRGDKAFLDEPRKILINNSTDESTFDEYDQLCLKYGFEQIHLDNLGVCGGRQFAAEHFHRSDSDFYMFFEDDMFINDSSMSSERCKVGLPKFVPNLYDIVHKIMLRENFDFLKFSFAEFYGENSVQWAWYNVPQSFRTQHWPNYDKLPEHGFDPNAPKTLFKNINIIDGVAYITGEIYYSNWPQIVSREGNKKMFLNTTWTHPYEQTWMSHMFQETIKGNLIPAILLASPITHDRVIYYPAEERREN